MGNSLCVLRAGAEIGGEIAHQRWGATYSANIAKLPEFKATKLGSA